MKVEAGLWESALVLMKSLPGQDTEVRWINQHIVKSIKLSGITIESLRFINSPKVSGGDG